MTELDRLIDAPHESIEAIAAHLDALSAEERWHQVSALGRDHQRTLFDKAAQASPILSPQLLPVCFPIQTVVAGLPARGIS